jgi:hypothetical protein
VKYYWSKETRKWVEKPDLPPQPRIHIWGDLPAYKSPLGTGVIEGRAARREDMRRGNCREIDPSEFTYRLIGPEAKGQPGYDPDYAKDHYAERKRNAGDRAEHVVTPGAD